VEEEGNWWSITFSDLVLLLLCFVVLWHIAEKRRSELPAPSQTIATLSPQDSQESSAATTRSDSTPDAATAALPPREHIEPPLESTTAPSPPLQSVAQPLSTNASWQELQSEINQYIYEQGLDRAVGVVSTEQGLVISLSDTITFPSGQAKLNSAVTPFLSRVAVLASERTELNIEIAGHTDDRPIATPEFPSNWELSATRASRVARTLLEQERIDPARVSTRGYAHYRPLYTNDTDEHRAANRRVEIRFFRRVETLDNYGYEW
jgi:chemotaxis protein MotB